MPAEGEAPERSPDAPQDEAVPEAGPPTVHGVPLAGTAAEATLHPTREQYPGLVEALRTDGYWVCVDLCGVDYLGHAGDRGLPPGVGPERFEVVANLLDHTNRRRVRLRVQVPEDDPRIASIARLHPGAENHERETWDLFGIAFDGHPDLSRILMPEEWEGHPLRKDHSVGRIPVQFKGARSAR